MTKTPVRLHDLFRYWRNLPHQLAAADQLEQQILAADPHLLDREQDWFHTWSQAGKQPEPDWVAPSLTIIKEFEGLRLEAYKCSAGEWTIGYGTTRYPGKDGGAVRKGDVITAEQAEAYLRDDVLGLHGPGIFHLMPPARNWPGHRIAALVSWAFNCGLGAVETSTLRKRINAGEDPLNVIPEELPRWNKADGKVLEGLTRRRNAEVALFVGHQLQQPEQPSTPGRVTPASPFSTRVTPHIQVGEFALFQEVRRFQHQHQVDTAAELAAFMERARVQFGGKPVVITSGYRPPAINRSVGGASGSEHLYDAPGVGAVDFLIQGADIRAVQAWCDKKWPYSLGYGAPKGFVHLGIRSGRPRVRWDY
jgi:GH24 family phage-related lysozyme (muramidase)